jgi:hypothetical protein
MSAELERQFGIINFYNDQGYGLSLIPEFLKWSPNFTALYKILVDQVQELHEAQKKVYSTVNIFEAEGTQLDNVFGNLLNVKREIGESDDDYRSRLLAETAKLSQSGQIVVMKNLFRDLVTGSTVSLFEQQSASFSMQAETEKTFTTAQLERIRATLANAKQAGNNMILSINNSTLGISFSLTGETGAGNGLGNGVLAQGF